MNRFSKGLLLLGLSTLAISAVAFAKTKRGGDWDIKKIKGSTIYFKNGEQLSTKLYDIRFVGSITMTNSSPIYIFSGTTCKDCDDHNSIFLFSPAEKKKTVTPEFAPYDFPGKEFSSEDSSLLYQTRMFYGNVLPNVPNGIIWYQDMLDETGDMQRSVYLIKVINNKLVEELIVENIPDIQETLDMVAASKAKEVTGADAVVEP